jgi:hypothetical protein
LRKFAEERKRGDSSGKNSKKSALFSILGAFPRVCLIVDQVAQDVNPVPLRGEVCACNVTLLQPDPLRRRRGRGMRRRAFVDERT